MTQLEIVNRALAYIGEVPALTTADTARGAKRALAAYSLCLDEVLRSAPWTCSLKRDWLYDCGEQATPWTALHHYGIGERVTNDTAKTYQCIVEGKSAAATGPTGTGASITDGTCYWNYVEASTAANNWCHIVLTAYVVGDMVSYDTGKVYRCITAGTTAAATPPTGITADITDGTVHWAYYGTIRANRTQYAYQYVVPYDCLRALKVPNQAAAKEWDQGVQYLIEDKFLYTDQVSSYLKYVYRADPREWDPLLQATVALRIAAEIAHDITGKESLSDRLFGALANQYALARNVAMNEGQEAVSEVVSWEDV